MNTTVNQEFGDAVTSLMKGKHLTFRAAEMRCGGAVSSSTIRQMMFGVVPGARLIVAYAEGVGESPEEVTQLANSLLRLANKPFRYDPSVLEE